MTDPLDEPFRGWVDRILTGPIPAEAVAFNFNLYEAPEGFAVELIGASRFDATDAEWACDEVFAARDEPFVLERGQGGESWERALARATTLIRGYLDDASTGGDRLRRAEAVAVGFVDGDLEVLWP